MAARADSEATGRQGDQNPHAPIVKRREEDDHRDADVCHQRVGGGGQSHGHGARHHSPAPRQGQRGQHQDFGKQTRRDERLRIMEDAEAAVSGMQGDHRRDGEQGLDALGEDGPHQPGEGGQPQAFAGHESQKIGARRPQTADDIFVDRGEGGEGILRAIPEEQVLAVAAGLQGRERLNHVELGVVDHPAIGMGDNPQ